MSDSIKRPKKRPKVSSAEDLEITEPTFRFLRQDELVRLVAMSPKTIEREEFEGRFPSRCALSASCVGWRSDEIQAWMEKRKAQFIKEPTKEATMRTASCTSSDFMPGPEPGTVITQT